MKEPADQSKKLLPLLAVIAVVIMLLGGLVGLVKRTTVPNDVLTNQEFLVKGYIQKHWFAQAAISAKPEQREKGSGEREFVGNDASRRIE